MLEFLAIAGLMVAVALLFRRLAALENLVAGLRDELEHREPGTVVSPAVALVEPEPAKPTAVTIRTARPAQAAIDPEPVAVAAPVAAEPAPRSRSSLADLDFEDLFGRRLPIWAGGVALAIAGVFLVRFSIERGLITPGVRVIAAFLFGLLLLGGAEAAYRLRERVADPRVAQALAGAGLATLYAGFYLAGSQYGLVGQTVAFLGLAAVTVAAIALSFRFGLPSAVLGLVGGFAAPALVGGEEANIPLLALYLGLVTAGLTLSGQRQQRPWMGIAALVGGLGWGALLLLAGDMGRAEVLALGLYLVVLGAVLPALAQAHAFERWLRLGAAAVASVQLALLVDQGGYAPLAWGLYLLLGGTLAALAWRRPETREGNAVAALVGVLLLAQWDAPPPVQFAAVAAVFAAIFILVPLALIGRGAARRVDLAQVALAAPALAAVIYATFGMAVPERSEPLLALATAMLALAPLAAAWLLRTRAQPEWFAAELASGAALAWAALLLVTPAWSAPIAAVPVLAGLAALAHRRGGAALANVLWAGAGASLIALAVTPAFALELPRLGGGEAPAPALAAMLRWAAGALPFAATAWLEQRRPLRDAADAAAALLAYGALAQILPADALAWTAALLAVACRLRLADRPTAQLALFAVTLLWALVPLAVWAMAGVASLAGDPVLRNEVPSVRAALLHLLPAVAALATVRSRPVAKGHRFDARWIIVPLAVIAAHVLYKQAFAITSPERFIALGMTERTVWAALLTGAAWLAAFRLGRGLAIALGGIALVHAALYTGLLHNPLWTAQAVGPLPLANWILAAGAFAIAAAWLLRGLLAERWRPWLDGLVIAIASVAALGLLRQAFAGTLPSQVPLGQTEDLLRSLLGIVLALAFLWLGSHRGERSWRVGSLVLMLVAVIKVFLFDTAGLEGLLRVASFMALGFSLIGIGWIYSRQLRARPAPDAVPAD